MSGSAFRKAVYVALAAAVLLHGDFWLWDDARRVLGLPVGLAYHVGYCVVISMILGLLVRFGWPVRRDL